MIQESMIAFQAGHVDGDRHLLQILSVTPSDEGSYSCVAENVLGQTHQMAFLVVNRSQMITNSLVLMLAVRTGSWSYG